MKRINIVAWHNGGGLSRDIDTLCNSFPHNSYEVTLNGFPLNRARVRRRRIVHRASNFGHLLLHSHRLAASPYDMNLFLEDISPGFIRHARVNAFIPNPEWYKQSQNRYLKDIDLVFCKSNSAQEAFDALGCTTRFIGFTSEDRLNDSPTLKMEPGFLHLAGRSWQKGTRPLIDLWLQHPEWPLLTVVQSAKTYSQSRVTAVDAPNINHVLERLDDAALRELQNTVPTHLFPSEAEGFGHCIVEAMSCGAVTLTTNAPPMNELITPERGVLVDYHKTRKQRSGTNYYVDPVDLERKIDAIMQMDLATQERLGEKARNWFVENDRDFRIRLAGALNEAFKNC